MLQIGSQKGGTLSFGGVSASIPALLLVAAGAFKLRRPYTFPSQVVAYDILPRQPSRAVGYVLPPLEIVTGVLLVFRTDPWSLIAAGLFIAFVFALLTNLYRGNRELSCACFGPLEGHISGAHVLGNLSLASLSLVAWSSHSVTTVTDVTTAATLLLTVLITTRGVASLRASSELMEGVS